MLVGFGPEATRHEVAGGNPYMQVGFGYEAPQA